MVGIGGRTGKLSPGTFRAILVSEDDVLLAASDPFTIEGQAARTIYASA